jgi:hypothetical protein
MRRAEQTSQEFTFLLLVVSAIDVRLEGLSPACVRSGISGWRDRALYPLAAGRRAARRILAELWVGPPPIFLFYKLVGGGGGRGGLRYGVSFADSRWQQPGQGAYSMLRLLDGTGS